MAKRRARTLIADAPGSWLPTGRFVLTAAVLLSCLVACAGTVHVVPAGSTLIENVPYFAQEDLQCGPTALATVINYWYRKGHAQENVTVESVAAVIYSPSARGVLGLDLELYARKLGFLTLEPPGTVEAIMRCIDAGLPVVVLVDLGRLSFQQNHFMVAKGYTDEGIIFNSGRQESLVISTGYFEKIWRKSGCWSLVIRPSSL